MATENDTTDTRAEFGRGMTTNTPADLDEASFIEIFRQLSPVKQSQLSFAVKLLADGENVDDVAAALKPPADSRSKSATPDEAIDTATKPQPSAEAVAAVLDCLTRTAEALHAMHHVCEAAIGAGDFTHSAILASHVTRYAVIDLASHADKLDDVNIGYFEA
jgi:hypothetical protein